ncbi:addiction module antidote protein [Bradyrhizobium sp. JYMT SZCCT0180]|uniref:addiction module antidote protein n=1 Tax=Bradyrhizobium sp. JYMT SZCCT0180 TaxID=2807666 RepID=UPI001BAD7EFF|nr:addiction module antidote protein [Bradyrhizobium sp. JYMT SZCCT0180]MBR1211216.1 putative addiction module antidote protein [Bradyrhizobium sp. JYMT SZCCT0180]
MARRASEAKNYRDNVEKYRDDPEMIAQHLNEAFARKDLAFILRAMSNVVRAQNVTVLAKKVGLNRASLYHRFERDKDPRLGGILKLLAVLGVELLVKPQPSTPAKRPRRKTSNA